MYTVPLLPLPVVPSPPPLSLSPAFAEDEDEDEDDEDGCVAVAARSVHCSLPPPGQQLLNRIHLSHFLHMSGVLRGAESRRRERPYSPAEPAGIAVRSLLPLPLRLPLPIPTGASCPANSSPISSATREEEADFLLRFMLFACCAAAGTAKSTTVSVCPARLSTTGPAGADLQRLRDHHPLGATEEGMLLLALLLLPRRFL